MARKNTTTRRAAAGKSTTRSAAAKAQPAWRESVGQFVAAGKGAADFVQRRGATVIEQAQRRSSALSQQARAVAEQRLETVAVKVVGAWDQVEQVASERVGRTLNRLGVPSQKDIDKLTRSVAKLSAQIDKLSEAAASRPAGTARSGRRAATA